MKRRDDRENTLAAVTQRMRAEAMALTTAQLRERLAYRIGIGELLFYQTLDDAGRKLSPQSARDVASAFATLQRVVSGAAFGGEEDAQARPAGSVIAMRRRT